MPIEHLLKVSSTMDYDSYFTAKAMRVKPYLIRNSYKLLLSKPNILSLAGGMPNPALFPFESATFNLTNKSTVSYSSDDMKRILQYSGPDGLPDLKNWIHEFHMNFHKPPFCKEASKNLKLEVLVSNGAMGALSLLFENTLGEEDTIILSTPFFAGTLRMFRAINVNMIGIEMDEDGMKLESIKAALEPWRKDENGKCKTTRKRPKYIVTIPTGHNPSGILTSLNRKKEIYKIAQEFDIMIVEDDPYYFIQFDENLIPSYQSLDVDGRVLRVDSISKVVSSGLRLGWISGPSPMIERLNLIQNIAIGATSNLNQCLVAKLFAEWGMDGFWENARKISSFYKEKKEFAMKAAKKWLTGIAEWKEPAAGIFVWIKLTHLDDSAFLFEPRTFDKGIVVVPGLDFELKEGAKTNGVRICYSMATPEMLDEGFKLLSIVVQEEMERLRKEKK